MIQGEWIIWNKQANNLFKYNVNLQNIELYKICYLKWTNFCLGNNFCGKWWVLLGCRCGKRNVFDNCSLSNGKSKRWAIVLAAHSLGVQCKRPNWDSFNSNASTYKLLFVQFNIGHLRQSQSQLNWIIYLKKQNLLVKICFFTILF